MIRTAICDDEAQARAYLSSLIQAQPYPCEIVEYASAGDLLAGLADNRPVDLLFLDIRLNPYSSALEGMAPDGMALARRLREQTSGQQPVIVFVTGYEQYVFDAFDVGAFQYLLKPVDEEKFSRVFARAAKQITSQIPGTRLAGHPAGLPLAPFQHGNSRENPQRLRTLTCQAAGICRTVPLDSIYYIESSNHKVLLHLKNGEFAYYAKIGELEKMLGEAFFRIHKGYLVNLSYVEAYSRTEVTLTSGDHLLLSKYKYQDFVKAYLRFLKRGWANE